MDYERQQHAPIYEALERFRKKRVVPFDVPGHKRGRGNPELAQLLGEKCVGLDVNSMKPLDNLCHPVSVIREAEELAADAFGAAHAFLMVGGTTSAVQSMILSVCKAGDKIILPRNVHKSAINALVLCGAIPVYVNPEVNAQLGISLGMEVSQVEKAMDENPDAVAVLINNPTYYGICSDLRTIVKKAHARGMKVLADEAHGTHLYFGRNLPVSGMAAGADMAAVSMHKSGGSLTQSSLLLLNKSMNAEKVRQIINLTQTTSASYLLLSSLDISRRNLALRGEESFEKVAGMAQYAREEINEIGGYYAYGMDLINGTSVFDFDVTKLSIYTLGNGLAGFVVYDLLRDDGIMVYQHGSPFYDEDEVECRKMHRKVFRSFPVSRVYQAHIPTCPSGYWLFGFASKKYHPLEDFRPERFDNLNIETWYYTTNLHRGAFMLPKYVEDLLEEEENSL